MNIDRKVIEQAIDALEQRYSDLIYDYAGAHHAKAFEESISALRKALAQSQPVQEPVAFVKSLDKPSPRCVIDLKYCSVAEHESGEHLKYIPLYTYPQAQPTRPLTETQADALNTLCKMLHSGEEVEGDDGLAMLVPMDLWSEAQDAIELLIGEDDGTEAAHGITTRHAASFRETANVKVGDMLYTSQQAAQPLTPDMFWNSDDADEPHDSIESFLSDQICQHDLEVGAVFTIWREKKFPSITIRVTAIDEEECEAEYEVIEQAHGITKGTT